MSKDTIYRQDVIELVKNSYYNLAESIDTWAMVADVEKLPSAQPEREKGKWILKKELVPLAWDCTPMDYDNYDEGTHCELKGFYHCSNCDWKSGEFKGGNFCPNCGTDMRGGQDEID